MKTLGFAGTAKNTGKTTTALHMLDLITQTGIRTALTSIGYDGENSDHVTGLVKPRYAARPGMTIATADSRLGLGTAKYSQIRSTGIRTILGEIVIAGVAEPGFVVLAGPNRRADIRTLLKMLLDSGIELTMLDGALNRMAGLAQADGLILATGAAFDERIQVVIEHAAAIEALFHYPAAESGSQGGADRVCYTRLDGSQRRYLDCGSVMDEDALRKVTSWLSADEPGILTVPGVFLPGLFKSLVEEHPRRLENKTFVFTSPLHLLAAGNPEIWVDLFLRLRDLGAEILYTTPIPLHFITVNPFFPKYVQKSGHFVAAYVNKQDLLQAARSTISHTPVIDVLQPPHPDLLALCGLPPDSFGG